MRVTEGNVDGIAITASVIGALAAGVVFLIATLFGDYDWVARLGGAVWIFILTAIILLPTINPWLRDRVRLAAKTTPHH